ncbi:enoyl-CoA hydratase-related protein [Alicyclobacillus herbarius]|uniref:enoyl-CoA hydratase-related protein n=1 Tax=Alicyclobacillus herbarius TaxID=122960 RepID=UPI00041A3982|nr:enoyl-CoA hydratase-related protein [Alicyclobacillus herbarius]
MAFTDILYTKSEGIATVTIHRPHVLNAFRAQTVAEMIEAFADAWTDREIGVVVLTGAGDKAFCVGGDQKERGATGTNYGGHSRSELGLDIEDLHALIRNIPKPVIAAVNGYAIGGGHVLHVVCDLSIASNQAVFGQVGPRVGSVDPGYGTAYLARVVGEKKAREIWYLCRRYTAAEALQMGLVNQVVAHADLYAEVRKWCDEILDKSPTALKLAKYSFNADTAHIGGIAQLGMSAVGLYYGTREAMEGNRAFIEKRHVNFRQFRRWPSAAQGPSTTEEET